MNAPGYFRPSRYIHGSSSRPARYGTKILLGGTVLLLSLLIPGWSAYAQTTLTPGTMSFGYQILTVPSAPSSAKLTNLQAVPLTISSIAITGGTAPADYAWGGNCPLSPSTLGAGKSCGIN